MGPARDFGQLENLKRGILANKLTDRRTEIDATKNTQVKQSGVETTLVNEPAANRQSCVNFQLL